MTYRQHTHCRVCNSERLIPYLDLGMMPLSNNLALSATQYVERYPLKVLLCTHCGLSQLSIVIPPEEMFSHYVYRSSINKGYVDHCTEMARTSGMNKDSFVIDIAGNDGALLTQFKEVTGCDVLNVDPAINLVAICAANGIPTIPMFWNMEVAKMITRKADLITATNVFAHCDDVRGFLEAAKYAMKPGGRLLLEFPYLINFIEGKEFDTVYFEHLSYFSIYPLTLLCKSAGLEVLSVREQDIHGGSVRVMIGQGVPDHTVQSFVKAEVPYRSEQPYHKFAEDVQLSIAAFRRFLMTHNNVAGFAASAKGNTLLNCAGPISGQLKYIVDQTPEKIGKYSPGTGIKIVDMNELINNPPSYLVVLSWNFADEIMSKVRAAGYVGKFVIPIPELKIIY